MSTRHESPRHGTGFGADNRGLGLANDETTMGGVPPADAGRFSRRQVLKWVIRLGYGAFAVAFVLPALAIRSLTQASKDVAVGDELVYAPGAVDVPVGEPLRAIDLEEGTAVQVFPRDKADNQNNLIEVVRIGAGEGAEGLVAYSAICTHLGCAVYARLNEDGNIACPCHASQFDPGENAKVVGGPAPRPLPSLPIQVNPDGVVVVNGAFSDRIGPQ